MIKLLATVLVCCEFLYSFVIDNCLSQEVTDSRLTFLFYIGIKMATLAEGDLFAVVENYIQTNKIMIFSKSRCPYCTKVKELFKSLGVTFFALELDTLENGAEMQQAMAKKAGRSSVPQVFINGEHIGGCDDTMAAHGSGKLKALL